MNTHSRLTVIQQSAMAEIRRHGTTLCSARTVDSLARRGLIIQDGSGWRVLSLNERAERGRLAMEQNAREAIDA